MKIKHALFLYLAGLCLILLGAIFKILHLPFADSMLILSTVLQEVGIFILIYKLFTHPKLKEMLNW